MGKTERWSFGGKVDVLGEEMGKSRVYRARDHGKRKRFPQPFINPMGLSPSASAYSRLNLDESIVNGVFSPDGSATMYLENGNSISRGELYY